MLGALGSVAGTTDRILALPSWLIVSLVFLLPALEASAFLGFIFPGEIAVILGGVAAYQGRTSLAATIVAAILGAVIGDSVGYFIGKRWGSHLLKGTIGRLPFIRERIDEHLESARSYVRRRKGRAVFFGRFTAALRVLVPGLAGMSEVHYPSFLLYNVVGGVLWGGGFALLGYLAGASYKHAEKIAGRLGLLLLGLIVVGLVLSRVFRRLRAQWRSLGEFGDRVARLRLFAWFRQRYPRQVAWLRGRLDPSSPRGFPLTFTLAVGALAAWSFGGLTQDVLGNDETALADPRVLRWVLAHRAGWLTTVTRSVTWLGSSAVVLPVLVLIGGYYLVRRRDWRPGAKLVVTVAGAIILYDIAKAAVGRPRPPASVWVGHYSGGAFPSGHATQSVALYGMLAVIVSAGRSGRIRTVIWSGAALIALLVGTSRIYLGAHWLSDVLGGYALGTTWLAVVVAFTLAATGPSSDRLEAVEPPRARSRRRDRRRAA